MEERYGIPARVSSYVNTEPHNFHGEHSTATCFEKQQLNGSVPQRGNDLYLIEQIDLFPTYFAENSPVNPLIKPSQGLQEGASFNTQSQPRILF